MTGRQLHLVAIYGSPRRNGNTDIMLDVFLEGLEGRVLVEKVVLSRMNVSPCLGCDACASGSCVQKDDMTSLYESLSKADILVLAAPVYFYGLPAHVKAVIDRGQLFFHRSRRGGGQKKGPKAQGFFLSCGATKGERLFEGSSLTVRYWFAAMGVEYSGGVFLRSLDRKGEIADHPEYLDEVRELSRMARVCKPDR